MLLPVVKYITPGGNNRSEPEGTMTGAGETWKPLRCETYAGKRAGATPCCADGEPALRRGNTDEHREARRAALAY